ncbi:MAG: hypothetical protein OXC72_02210, partial [Roseovarius sp.]|nr:hypothetical protein [Roseovarius sp.]
AFPFDLTDCNIRVRIVLPNQMLEDVMSMRDYLPHVEALVAKMTLCNGTFGTDGKSALETVAADSIIRPRWNDRAGFQWLEFANAHTGLTPASRTMPKRNSNSARNLPRNVD